ncbi:hypothetical protein AB0D49_38735 [Streptomyces sp. NPDC048290]|uniref:hypothetical protein n=1 Tax=Streptomyces sp. NPDC048290 TaxID=3155811 RepID=UPI0034236056
MTTRLDPGPGSGEDDPLAVILRPAAGDRLAVPPGRYEAIRRTAARRRLLRTAAGAGLAGAVAVLIALPVVRGSVPEGPRQQPTVPLAPGPTPTGAPEPTPYPTPSASSPSDPVDPSDPGHVSPSSTLRPSDDAVTPDSRRTPLGSAPVTGRPSPTPTVPIQE